MNTGCIVQARNTSTRLPGKVTKILNYEKGSTVLEEVISRLKRAESIDSIIIATTVNPDDDSIVKIAEKTGVNVFRGSENDVLERFYLAATENSLDSVIRITSDCPFVDPGVLDRLVKLFREGGYDYASNCVKRTFPHGLDCEVFTFEALKKAYDETDYSEADKFYREHVTTYLHTQPDQFSIGSLTDEEDNSQIRITVDTRNDYLLACVLKTYLGEEYTYRDIVAQYKVKPFLSEINADAMQKKRYESKQEELNAAVELLKLQEMNFAADCLAKAEADIS